MKEYEIKKVEVLILNEIMSEVNSAEAHKIYEGIRMDLILGMIYLAKYQKYKVH